MTIKRCDRCGAVYEFYKGAKKQEAFFIKKRVEGQLSNDRVVDLCPKCRDFLEHWMEGKE